MSWYTRALSQTVTHWTAGTPDGFGGYSYTVQTLGGRWQFEQDVFYDQDGAERRSTTTVYLAQRVSPHDWLARGDHSDTTDPTTVDRAAEIQAVRETTGLGDRTTVYKALLQEEGQGG